jgi:hypothetical protein
MVQSDCVIIEKRSRTISRILCPLPGGCHSSRAAVTRRLQQPTRRVVTGPATFLFGLAPDGVYRACRVTATTGGLLPHLFTLTRPSRAVCFCGTIPGSPPLDVIQHPALWCPDFPLPALRPAATACPAPQKSIIAREMTFPENDAQAIGAAQDLLALLQVDEGLGGDDDMASPCTRLR